MPIAPTPGNPPCVGARAPAALAVVVTVGVAIFFGSTMDMGTISEPLLPAAALAVAASPLIPANDPVAGLSEVVVVAPPEHAASKVLAINSDPILLFMIPRPRLSLAHS